MVVNGRENDGRVQGSSSGDRTLIGELFRRENLLDSRVIECRVKEEEGATDYPQA